MEEKYPQDILFRNQFFFGLSQFPSEKWKVFEMPGGYCLSAHPDLEVDQTASRDFQVTLLGFVLDPDHPRDSNGQILTRLCDSADTIPQFIELTEPLGGRWVLFLYQKDTAVVLNDPGGLRAVYYHVDPAGNAWLASQPGLIVQKFGFEVSPEAARYMQSPGYIRRLEAFWPGDGTPYTQIKHLLPNHLLDLRTNTVKRFWPTKPLKRYSLAEGVRLAGDTVKGVLTSAHNRFPLAVSLSSGYDSRVVLAGCKDFASDVFLFSLQYRKLTPESDDIRIPREIARALELTHHLVDCREPVSREFAEIYTRNVTTGQKNDWGSIIEARYHHVPRERVVLKGNISEIVRCRYWGLGIYPFRVTLRDLVRLMHHGDDPLVTQGLKSWMMEAVPSEKLGYKLLDLFSWEIEIGNWMGLAPIYFDLAQTEFTPFSNRRLINIMLGVHPKYRSYPEHIMERRMVAYLWPELSVFPYTPGRNIPKKRLLEGPILNGLRWVKYLLFEEKYGRLEE